MTANDYIHTLAFDHIETYSFQRGIEHEAKVNKYYKLRHQRLTPKEELEFLSLKSELWETSYLVNSNGQFHPTKEKTGIYHFSEERTKQLIEILKTPIVEISSWMCAPYYRDAIVFYRSNKTITSVLNVCLSCEVMQLGNHEYIAADTYTYLLLKQFFILCGHKVE